MKILRGIRSKDDKFRASCGAFIVNKNRQAVLSFERKGLPGSRQLPQGGVKVYETPLDGIYRELEEETGIKRKDLKLIGEYPEWVVYVLPEKFRSKKHGRGQVQKFFYFEFLGDEKEIDLVNVQDNEFDRFFWSHFRILTDRTVQFRRGTYKKLIDYFEKNLMNE